MPIYTIETPAGRKLKIEAATESDALRGARQWHAENGQAKPAGPVFDPARDAGRALDPALKAVADDVRRGGGPGSAMRLAGVGAAGLQALVNQVTGPASRALAKYGPQAYGRPAAPWQAGFGEAPRALEGEEAAAAIEGDLNTALMGLRPGPKGLKPLPPKVARPAEPQVRAARAIERARARDLAAGDTPAVAPGAMPIHQGGENLAAVADVLANSPGPGRGVIRKAVRDYEGRAVDRTKADIARDLGGRGDFFETQENLINARRAAADEGMATIQDHLVTLDNNSVLALRSDLAKGAIRERALNALASPDEAVRADGARLMRLADDLLDKPGSQTITVRDAQDISRSLLEGANAAYASGNGGRGAALKELGKAVRTNASTPERGGFQEYGDWLRQYGDDMAREQALQLGRDVFKPGGNAEQLRAAVGEMSEAERLLYRKGVGEALLDQVRSTKGDVGALRNLMRSEENAERVALAFPDDQAFANFMESAARRVGEREVNNRILGGSPTDPRQAARADLQAEGFDPLGAMGDALTGDIGGLARRGAREAIRSLPRQSRSVINDPEANLALARALTDENEMTALLNQLQAARARDARLRAVLQRAAPLLLETGAASSEAQKVGR